MWITIFVLTEQSEFWCGLQLHIGHVTGTGTILCLEMAVATSATSLNRN